MGNSKNTKKSQQLGMPYGTANGRLRKQIMFQLVQQSGRDICFQCGEKIEHADNLSIEHKEPWLDSKDPISKFYDLENIAFSHTSCNYGAARKPEVHPTQKDPLEYARKMIGKSGFKGVSVATGKNFKYHAFIRHNNKNVHIKYGNDPVVLAKMYDEKALELFGEDAITNLKLGLL